MIKRAEELQQVEVHELRGGEGTLLKTLLGNSEETFGHASLFATFTYPPGSSIGYHTHEGETELYYFIAGTGRVSDDGVFYDVKPGDSMCTPTGHGHGVENTGSEDMEILAVIVLD